jgi:hypothetical protein
MRSMVEECARDETVQAGRPGALVATGGEK